MRFSRILPVFLFALLIAASPAFAETVMFRADSMTGSSGKGGDFARLKGNASITTESVEIFADSIELSGKGYRYIKASGNVSGTNIKEKIDFTCAEMHYDRELRISSMQDSVHLVDRANEAVANAQLMEYDEKSGSVVMQISVAMQQKDNVCTGSYAIYNTKTRKLFLSGNPQIVQGTDTFRAQEIVLDLDTNEVTLDGRVRGAVRREDE